MPSTHETSLDLTLIKHFSEFSVPVSFSHWTLQIQTHYLGGGRHFGQWEIADIGLLVIFRRAGHVVRTKACLLQSKRLYPHEGEADEDNPIDYERGFGRLLQSDEDFLVGSEPRHFSFTDLSAYERLSKGDRQYLSIGEYERKYGIPVYYLLYNPLKVPWTVKIPLDNGNISMPRRELGARVLPAKTLRRVCSKLRKNRKPTLKLISACTSKVGKYRARGGWVFEEFIVRLVLGCVAGYLAPSPGDRGLRRIFSLREGPIAAAIAVTIDFND